MVIKGYSDADWNGVTDSNLSATGWVVYLGDVPVNWCFKTQKCTSRSNAESEFIALSSVAQEMIYVKSIRASMHNVPLGVTNVYLSRPRPKVARRRWISWKIKALLRFSSRTCTCTSSVDCKYTSAYSNCVPFLQVLYVEDQQLDLHHKSGKMLVADILTKVFGPVGEKGHEQQSDFIHAFTQQLVGHPAED